MRTLCVGECIVDLICQRPVTTLHEADSFTPYAGGVTANVAVAAARAGADVMFAGGAGDDRWGAGGDVVEVSRYELYRALFSRRSRAQVQAWGSPVLDAGRLDELPVFGPRDDDQPLPG